MLTKQFLAAAVLPAVQCVCNASKWSPALDDCGCTTVEGFADSFMFMCLERASVAKGLLSRACVQPGPAVSCCRILQPLGMRCGCQLQVWGTGGSEVEARQQVHARRGCWTQQTWSGPIFSTLNLRGDSSIVWMCWEGNTNLTAYFQLAALAIEMLPSSVCCERYSSNWKSETPEHV